MSNFYVFAEKEDLIKCFFKYVQLEPQLKNKRSNVNFRAAYTSNTRYSSTPNLAGANRERRKLNFNTFSSKKLK